MVKIKNFNDKKILESVTKFGSVYLAFNKLSEDFMDAYWDILVGNYRNISIHQKLSESFMERHWGELYPDEIIRSQTLSEEFIERHLDDLDWNLLSTCQELSKEFMEKYWVHCGEHQCLFCRFCRNRTKIMYILREPYYYCPKCQR